MMYRLELFFVRCLRYYQPDNRALALMRIALGLVVLIDLFIRLGDLNVFYGDDGVWPSAYVYSFGGKLGMWSLCTVFKAKSWIVFLFVLNVFAACTFTIGYKTRLSNLLLWILTLSFQNRNLYILQAGDDLLRLLLFWGLFLPWHQYFCIDKQTEKKSESDSLGKLGYLLLPASVYFFSAALKTSTQWTNEGTAIYHALSLDALRTNLGTWLYQSPILTKFLTHTVYYVEWILPFLILWPSKKGQSRMFAFILILVLHFGFSLFMHIGLFALISIVAGIGLIPGYVLDHIFKNQSIQSELIKQNHFYIQLKNGLALVCLFLCLSVNVSSLSQFNYQLKKQIWVPIYILRLDQFWGMFAPAVPTQNNWMVYQAYNQIGQQYDIWNDQEYVDFNKNINSNRGFKSDRWRKLAENVQNEHYSFLRPHYCRQVLKHWNNEHPKNKMSTLNLYSMSEIILPNYQSLKPTKKFLCVCDEN